MASLTQISTGIGTSTINGPLGSLVAGTLPSLALSYPYDLGSSTKKHYVKFTIKQIDTTKFNTNTNALSQAASAAGSLFGHDFNAPTVTIERFIALYMPDTLNATYSADFGELSITDSLGAAVTMGNYATSIRESNADRNKNSGQITATEAALLSGMTKSVAALSLGLLSSDTSTVLLNQNGVAINPQLQMIFRSIGFRQFQLSFTFTPNSQQEAETIAQIISTFRYHFAPDILSASSAKQGLFFIPPSFFNIEFMFDTTENAFLPKYGDCVLENIDVNYAPNGFAAHIDGSPVQTQLTLTFKEIEIVTKSKLKADYTGETDSTTTYGSGGLR